MFQTIPFSLITGFCLHTFKCKKQFYLKQFSSIWPIDRALSDATTAGQSGLGSDSNEGALYISQSSSITETSSSEM